MCKIVFLLLASAATVLAADLRDMSVTELLKLGGDLTQIRPKDVRPSDVAFYVFTESISNQEITKSGEVFLNNSRGTKFLIHGWLESHSRSWYQKLTTEFLRGGAFNVVQVDWERVARSSYISSAENTKLVGEEVADFILNQHLDLEGLHLIGHSLGAHVAAFAAKKLNTGVKKVRRITGLDPAGPYFREIFITENQRLNKNDAQIVDAIHTDGGVYGYEKPIGTLDIYVNGGKRIQPGCLQNFKLSSIGELLEDSFCSHAKSTLYFIDLTTTKFTCTKCPTWESFDQGKCESNEKYVFSAEDIDETMTGVCYVKTSKQKPQFFNNLFNFDDLLAKSSKLFNRSLF